MRIFYKTLTCIFVVTVICSPSWTAWAASPPRKDVKEVKFHTRYSAQLKAIEKEACDHYERTGSFKVFQEKTNPRAGDVKTINFGYSCVHPKNPQGGWVPLESVENELDALVAATEKAKTAGENDPQAGQVIVDEVWLAGYPYRKNIFPDILPDNPELQYELWTFKAGTQNPKRMAILEYREVTTDPKCPQGQRLGTLATKQQVCYTPAPPPEVSMVTDLAWHDHSVFEQYENDEPVPVSVPESTLVLVDAPDPVLKTDNWKYEKR